MQLDIAFARRSDPATADKAAAAVDAMRLELLVADTLRRHGPLTTAEIAEITGQSIVSISPRMKPMEARGIVVRDGKRKNPSGSTATVWRLA